MKNKEFFKRIIINGEETNYEISNYGRCRNIKKGKFLKQKYRQLKPLKKLDIIDYDNRYIDYTLYVKKKRIDISAYRLVAMMFIPIPKIYTKQKLSMNDLVVDHKDNIKYNNHVSNLQWLTRNENREKAIKDNRMRYVSGYKHGLSKYTKDQIDFVGKLLEENVLTTREISNATKVNIKTINKIIHKQSYKYLSEKYNIENFDKFSRRYIDKSTIMECLDLLENTNLSIGKIAKKLNVSKGVVKDILHKRIHKNLSKDYLFKHRL